MTDYKTKFENLKNSAYMLCVRLNNPLTESYLAVGGISAIQAYSGAPQNLMIFAGGTAALSIASIVQNRMSKNKTIDDRIN